MTRRLLLQAAALRRPAPEGPPAGRFLGVTVLPEFIQTEGAEGVLDRLVHLARATAVTTSPYVMEPADETSGSREPPIDAGAGQVRLLDRPLWGRRELFVRTAPSYSPDARLYRGLRYQPSAPGDLTRRQGPLVGEFLRAARAAGLKVYLQVQAAIPPGYRVQFGGPAEADRPRLPDGRIPPRRLANNGSLASEEIRRSTHALIRDLCRAYPEIDGLRLDWPEYPPYLLDDVFLDFSPPAALAAERLGFGFERMRRDVADVYRFLHGGLRTRDLEPWLGRDGGRFGLLATLARHPGLLELARFKAALVDEFLAGCHQALQEAGGREKELLPNAFPPPFSLASGMDFQRAGRHSAGISVKLYTMHWPMMLRFYAEQLLAANPGLPEEPVVRALARWFDIEDETRFTRLADCVYPEPDQPHPAGLDAQQRKIRQARAEAGATPVFALAHAYGPPEDFRKRLDAAWRASGGRVWINRYGYLSDQKLRLAGDVAAG